MTRPRISRTRRPRISRSHEIRCFHTSGTVIQAKSGTWSLYLCGTCYNNLVRTISSGLKHDEKYTPDPLGVYCVRCDSRRLGDFVRVQIVEYGLRRRSKGVEYNFGKPKITYQVYCGECWAEIWTAPKLLLKTKRSFYLPDEEAGVFKALFGRGVERTSQVYTLVKTEDLRKLVRLVPKEEIPALEEILSNDEA